MEKLWNNFYCLFNLAIASLTFYCIYKHRHIISAAYNMFKFLNGSYDQPMNEQIEANRRVISALQQESLETRNEQERVNKKRKDEVV